MLGASGFSLRRASSCGAASWHHLDLHVVSPVEQASQLLVQLVECEVWRIRWKGCRGNSLKPFDEPGELKIEGLAAFDKPLCWQLLAQETCNFGSSYSAFSCRACSAMFFEYRPNWEPPRDRAGFNLNQANAPLTLNVRSHWLDPDEIFRLLGVAEACQTGANGGHLNVETYHCGIGRRTGDKNRCLGLLVHHHFSCTPYKVLVT